MYDKLIRSKRRTLGLEITQNAEIILRVPEHARDSDIEKFLKKSARWIQKHKEKVLRQIRETPKKEWKEGEMFLYLGSEYSLPREREGKKRLLAWYKKEAKKVLQERVKIYACLDNVSFKKICITSARRRWGSCGKNSLNFTWRLVMAPIEIIDYVTAHEVAHLTHKNHKKRFHAKVKKLYPNYKWAKVWLKQNGHLLNI
ncbi:MAG: SprT family zinc-dependent metalloprotease [bacterium]|nr:SprT family zinc-dependent metalloprotease [bacterium]